MKNPTKIEYLVQQDEKIYSTTDEETIKKLKKDKSVQGIYKITTTKIK